MKKVIMSLLVLLVISLAGLVAYTQIKEVRANLKETSEFYLIENNLTEEGYQKPFFSRVLTKEHYSSDMLLTYNPQTEKIIGFYVPDNLQVGLLEGEEKAQTYKNIKNKPEYMQTQWQDYDLKSNSLEDDSTSVIENEKADNLLQNYDKMIVILQEDLGDYKKVDTNKWLQLAEKLNIKNPDGTISTNLMKKIKEKYDQNAPEVENLIADLFVDIVDVTTICSKEMNCYYDTASLLVTLEEMGQNYGEDFKSTNLKQQNFYANNEVSMSHIDATIIDVDGLIASSRAAEQARIAAEQAIIAAEQARIAAEEAARVEENQQLEEPDNNGALEQTPTDEEPTQSQTDGVPAEDNSTDETIPEENSEDSLPDSTDDEQVPADESSETEQSGETPPESGNEPNVEPNMEDSSNQSIDN